MMKIKAIERSSYEDEKIQKIKETIVDKVRPELK